MEILDKCPHSTQILYQAGFGFYNLFTLGDVTEVWQLDNDFVQILIIAEHLGKGKIRLYLVFVRHFETVRKEAYL